jgi:hypothetical protein
MNSGVSTKCSSKHTWNSERIASVTAGCKLSQRKLAMLLTWQLRAVVCATLRQSIGPATMNETSYRAVAVI